MVSVLLFTAMAFGADTSALRPPAGAKVAIIVFEDLQCPSCGSAEPLFRDAARSEKVPLVRHDFPIPMHNWSGEAHVIARYFDTKSPELGEEYRHWILTNQGSITKPSLRQMSDRFAQEHKTALPLFIDPSGALQTKVTADFNLGQKVGVTQTPTVFVVGDVKNGQPVVMLTDLTQLVATVDNMKRQVEAEAPAKPAAKSASTHKKSGK